ncbi:hypothetical protein BB561_005101 [Smittium simulii]|uniref:Uncharacterized protein n=1 Tax=Smittium simulii TaxID=133385 RepID=A0A2T9YC63_9FUNG|nr:hypothetical protein BB561_005101 [Smittium simulii]
MQLYEFLLKVCTSNDPDVGEESNSQPNSLSNNCIKNGHIVYSKKCEAMNRLFAEITGEDENLELLFNSKELLQYMTLNLNPAHIQKLEEKKEKELIFYEGIGLAILIIMGNLARKDEYSQFYANSILSEFIVSYWITRTSKVDIRSCFAAVGVIRNLCILDSNKGILTRLGLLDAVYPWINSSVVPIQSKTLGIYRHLTLSKIPNCDAKFKTVKFLLSVSSGLDIENLTNISETEQITRIKQIIDIAGSSDILSVRCESVRLLISILKVLIIEFNEKERDQYVQTISVMNILEPIVKLIIIEGATHQLLAVEGIDCLSVLAAFDSKHSGYGI